MAFDKNNLPRSSNGETTKKPSTQVFISYGRQDAAEFAHHLAKWFREQGVEPWLDVENGIPVGSPFDVRIEQGIKSSDAIMALLSPYSVREESYLRKEILYAQNKGKPIIPVRIANAEVPITICNLNYIDAVDDPKKVFHELPKILDEVRRTGRMSKRELQNLHAGGESWLSRHNLSDFQEELASHGGRFIGREWLFDDVQDNLQSPDSRVVFIVGGVGVGKSAIAAQSTARLNVKGAHFCSRSREGSCRVVNWLKDLMAQLAYQFPEYGKRISQIEPDWNSPPEAIFRGHVVEPLSKVVGQDANQSPLVFVIDALDEAVAVSGDSEFPRFIAESVDRIPDWLRLVVTMRPDRDLLARFDNLPMVRINYEDSKNEADIVDYTGARVKEMGLEDAERDEYIMRLPGLAAGNFLYVKTVLDFREKTENPPTLDELQNKPGNLHRLFFLLMERRFPDIQKYRKLYRPLFQCLVAAQAPLPEPLLVEAAHEDTDTGWDSLRVITHFLEEYIAQGEDRPRVSLFHTSFREFLLDDRRSGNYQALSEKGHELLAEACWQEIKKKGADLSNYIAVYAGDHFVATERWDTLATMVCNTTVISWLWFERKDDLMKWWNLGQENISRRLVDDAEKVARNSNVPGGDLINLGNLLNVQGHLESAIVCYKKAAAIFRSEGDHNGLSISLGNQAGIFKTWGECKKAMELLKEQEVICREIGLKLSLARCLGNQATIHEQWGNLDVALGLHMTEESMFRDMGQKEDLRISLGNQGIIYRQCGKLDKAIELHKKEEEISRDIGSKDGLQRAFGNQALVFLQNNELSKAMELFKDQEKICRDLGLKKSLQSSFGNQAVIHNKRGDLNKAMELHKEEEKICRELGLKISLQASLGNQAGIFAQWRMSEEGLKLLKEQEHICKEFGFNEGLAGSLINQASLSAFVFSNKREGLALAAQALAIAEHHGYKALANQIRHIQKAIESIA